MNRSVSMTLAAVLAVAFAAPYKAQADQLSYGYATTIFVVGAGTTMDGFRYGGGYENPGGAQVVYTKLDGTVTQNPVGDYAVAGTHPGIGLPNMTARGQFIWVGIFAVETSPGKAVIEFVPFCKVKSADSTSDGSKITTDSDAGNFTASFAGREVLLTDDSGYGADKLHNRAATSIRVGTIVSNSTDSSDSFTITDPAGAGVLHEGDFILPAPEAHGKFRLIGTVPMDYLPPGADRNLPADLNYNWRIFTSDGHGHFNADFGPAVPYTLANSDRSTPGVFDMGGIISPIATGVKFGVYFQSTSPSSRPLLQFLTSGIRHTATIIESPPAGATGASTIVMADYIFMVAKRVFYQFLTPDSTVTLRFMGWTE